MREVGSRWLGCSSEKNVNIVNFHCLVIMYMLRFAPFLLLLACSYGAFSNWHSLHLYYMQINVDTMCSTCMVTPEASCCIRAPRHSNMGSAIGGPGKFLLEPLWTNQFLKNTVNRIHSTAFSLNMFSKLQPFTATRAVKEKSASLLGW